MPAFFQHATTETPAAAGCESPGIARLTDPSDLDTMESDQAMQPRFRCSCPVPPGVVGEGGARESSPRRSGIPYAQDGGLGRDPPYPQQDGGLGRGFEGTPRPRGSDVDIRAYEATTATGGPASSAPAN